MILEDEKKIRAILRDTYEKKGSPFYVENDPRAIYLYNKGCLFPAFFHGEVITIHASIPKKRRGKSAIIAAKEVIQWALNHYRLRAVLTRVDEAQKHWNRYAIMCGFKRYKTKAGYNYYEVLA